MDSHEVLFGSHRDTRKRYVKTTKYYIRPTIPCHNNPHTHNTPRGEGTHVPQDYEERRDLPWVKGEGGRRRDGWRWIPQDAPRLTHSTHPPPPIPLFTYPPFQITTPPRTTTTVRYLLNAWHNMTSASRPRELLLRRRTHT